MNKSFTLTMLAILLSIFDAFTQTYCDAAGAEGTGADFITRVSVHTLDNTSEQSFYSDFTQLSTQLIAGQEYTLLVEIGATFNLDFAYAWIDFNQDFVFDTTEQITMSDYAENISMGTFTVPEDAVLGSTRLRVRNVFISGGGENDPCGNYFGEVEDYTVELVKYCDAAGAEGTTADFITRVTLNTLNNASEQTFYSDFTQISTTLVTGEAYTLFIEIGTTFSQDFAYAWIDFNQNFVFDTTEQITMSDYTDNISMGTFTVPENAVLGNTRLRVRNVFISQGGENDPCGAFFGEVEDYTVELIDVDCPNVGTPCDDGLDCSINDVIQLDCTCKGEIMDDDFDNICNEDDICPGFNDNIDENSNGIPDGCESYCPAAGTNGTGADWISKVRLYTLVNTSGKSSYSDFTNLSVELVQGAQYTITVNMNAWFLEDILHTWIDFNQNLIFENDEAFTFDLFDFETNSASAVITVPANATLGETRMRVRNTWSTSEINFPQCFNYFGEVEDYTVSIKADNCPNVGQACDDGLDCSINDKVDVNCNCFGEIVDDDLDNICNEEDVCPGEDDSADLNQDGIKDCLDYCLATGSEGTGGDYISSVEFLNGAVFPSGQTNYTDNTDSIVINLVLNESYFMIVRLFQVFEGDQVYGWIDYNQDKDFTEDEALEFIFSQADTIFASAFTVPENASLGKTRMRIRNIFNGGANPCFDFFGEVEDYTVDITTVSSTNNIEVSGLNLFPNPANDQLQIHSEFETIKHIELYDVHGRLNAIQKVDSKNHSFNISYLNSGMYYAKIVLDNDNTKIMKFVVQD